MLGGDKVPLLLLGEVPLLLVVADAGKGGDEALMLLLVVADAGGDEALLLLVVADKGGDEAVLAADVGRDRPGAALASGIK